MRKGRVRISDEQFIGLLRSYRSAQPPASAAEVPAHTDAAAQRAFRQMEAWIAAGAMPEPAVRRPVDAGGITAAKLLAVTLASAAVLGTGAYVASPAVRGFVDGLAEIGHALYSAPMEERSPADYVIPSPGEGYELREEVSTDTAAAKWFTAERRLLMVQIAKELPETPESAGEPVMAGGMAGMAYDVGGDRQLLLYDGGLVILIKMYNADLQELLDYAEAFAAANGK